MLVKSISVDKIRNNRQKVGDSNLPELAQVPHRRDGVRALGSFPLPLHRMWLKEHLADETVKSIKWDFQCPGSADNSFVLPLPSRDFPCSGLLFAM